MTPEQIDWNLVIKWIGALVACTSAIKFILLPLGLKIWAALKFLTNDGPHMAKDTAVIKVEAKKQTALLTQIAKRRRR